MPLNASRNFGMSSAVNVDRFTAAFSATCSGVRPALSHAFLKFSNSDAVSTGFGSSARATFAISSRDGRGAVLDWNV